MKNLSLIKVKMISQASMWNRLSKSAADKCKHQMMFVMLCSMMIGCTDVYPTRDGRFVAVNAGTGYWGYVNSAMEMPLSWNPPPPPPPSPWRDSPPRPVNPQYPKPTPRDSDEDGRDSPTSRIQAEQEAVRENQLPSNPPKIISY
jgi:hypothetical protein